MGRRANARQLFVHRGSYVKPEVTAADGVATQFQVRGSNLSVLLLLHRTPAIGALLLEADPPHTGRDASGARKQRLGQSGRYRDSGVGIITATGALGYVFPSYSVTASANPASYGTVACTPNSVLPGDDATCTAEPNEGYQFDG